MPIKSLAKPKKKVSKAKLKAKADALASAYYRAETPYCELSGRDQIICNGPLQWMHLYSRAILHMRYEPYNKLIGCAGHHFWYTNHPIEWVRFLEMHFPERLEQAEANRYKVWKVDYEIWTKHFKERLAEQTRHGAEVQIGL